MMLVKGFMGGGGDFVGDMFAKNPVMMQFKDKATEEIENMTPKERGELINKMQKKISIFAQLPPDDRERHMSKLSDDDKLEFVKAQILIISVMKQQWQAQQHSGHHGQHPHPQCPHRSPQQSGGYSSVPQQTMGA